MCKADRSVRRSRNEVAAQKFTYATYDGVMTWWRYSTEKSRTARKLLHRKVGACAASFLMRNFFLKYCGNVNMTHRKIKRNLAHNQNPNQHEAPEQLEGREVNITVIESAARRNRYGSSYLFNHLSMYLGQGSAM